MSAERIKELEANPRYAQAVNATRVAKGKEKIWFSKSPNALMRDKRNGSEKSQEEPASRSHVNADMEALDAMLDELNTDNAEPPASRMHVAMIDAMLDTLNAESGEPVDCSAPAAPSEAREITAEVVTGYLQHGMSAALKRQHALLNQARSRRAA